MFRIQIIIVSFLLLVGCADRVPTKEFYLKRDQTAILPPLENNQEEIAAQQLLTTSIKGKELTMLAIFNADHEKIRLLGLTPVGVKLLQIDYDGEAIIVEKYISMLKIPEPSQILADIMLAYFPLRAWESQLPNGWKIEEKGVERWVKDEKGDIIVTIGYEKIGRHLSPISIKHHRFDYLITLENIQN